MSEFISVVIDVLHFLPDWFWDIVWISIFLYFSILLFRHLYFLLDDDLPFSSDAPLPDIPDPVYHHRWQVKVADFFCRWYWGFKLMYFLGWAVEGRHYVDCEQDHDQETDLDPS